MTTARSNTRKTPSKPSSPKPSLVDQMGEDAAAADAEFPEGAPEFKPPLALRPRSRRAELKRRLAEAAERFDKVNELRKDLGEDGDEEPPVAVKMRVAAEMDELYQAIDDALRVAAVDPEAYAAWSDEASDEELGQTFNAYQARSQPGEAPSSAS